MVRLTPRHRYTPAPKLLIRITNQSIETAPMTIIVVESRSPEGSAD